MIVGDGDSNRTDRANILDADLAFAGTYSGSHVGEGHQSCLVFTQDYTDNIEDSEVVLDTAAYETLDSEIFVLINEVRDDPSSIVQSLKDMIPNFDSTGFIYKVPGKFAITYIDGVTAVNEAITLLEALNVTGYAPALTQETGIDQAC